MLIEKHSFEGGMDGDTSQRLLPPNVMLNCMNASVSVSQTGRNLRIENRKSTQLISQQVRPPYGVDFTVGSAVDFARNRIIYFNDNTFSDKGIYAHDLNTGTVYAVLYDSQVIGGLPFSKTYRVDRNAKVIGDLLYFTVGNGEVWRFNIEAAIKMNKGSYNTTVTPYSWPINKSVVTLIRRPLGLPPTTTKSTSIGVAQNFIYNFAGQFASRLVYRDGEYSVISVPSTMLNFNYTTDTFNGILIAFPFAEKIDQDVQIVQVVVRFGNNPNYFIIKEWNKANAADLIQINLHNSGITPLSFTFSNNIKGNAIDEFNSVKDADSIGLNIKSLEIATNRLFLANYDKGYNTPATTSLTATVNSSTGTSFPTTVFHAISPYQIAVQFRDNYGRRCSVVTDIQTCTANIPDRNYAYSTHYPTIGWSLSNVNALIEIPVEAVYYDILITKNLRTRFFLESIGSPLQYVKKDTNGNFVYQTTYDTGVYGIALNGAYLNFTNQGYVFNDGDLVKVYLNSTSTVYELAVLAPDGTNIIVAPTNLGDLTTSPACVFELYTPYQTSLDETFYTTGLSYSITNAGTASRQYSTTSGTIGGDCYMGEVALLSFRYETMSPNPQIDSQAWTNIYGQFNFKSLLGQVDKSGFFSWSNQIILGSQTNGLSSFEYTSEKPIPAELGAINKIILTNKMANQGEGNVMLAICAGDTASMYLGETQLVAAAQQGDVAISQDVVGTINVLKGSMGTINPESVIEYLGLVFWFDALNGFFVQYSNNGLEAVSKYKQARFFKNYSKDYISASTNNLDNINGFHHIPTAIDPFYKEVLCTLPGLIYQNYANTLPSYTSVPSYATSIIDRFDIYDELNKTMAFKFEENKWGSNYEFSAEWYEFLQDRLFGFKNGIEYEHNVGSGFNSWYGTTYPVRIFGTGNINASLLKDLANIAIESNAAPDFSVAMANYPNVQITDLASTDYTNQQGTFYATWLRDRISPNSSGTADQKLYTGDVITDIAIFWMVEFQQYSNLFYCNFVNIGWMTSKGQLGIADPINK